MLQRDLDWTHAWRHQLRKQQSHGRDVRCLLLRIHVFRCGVCSRMLLRKQPRWRNNPSS
jgi:hypothetical protein